MVGVSAQRRRRARTQKAAEAGSLTPDWRVWNRQIDGELRAWPWPWPVWTLRAQWGEGATWAEQGSTTDYGGTVYS